MSYIGKSVVRKESLEKVTGKAKYTSDYFSTDALHVEMVKSTYAHANILSIQVDKAQQLPGVRAVVLGDNLPLIGEEVIDRPALAVNKVRYYGEVMALIVADTISIAKQAAALIQIDYEPLPVVNSPQQSLQKGAPFIHADLENYSKDAGIYPMKGTNIINHTKIRKGNISKGFSEGDISIESSFSVPLTDHAAMETRSAFCSIDQDGTTRIMTSSQAPYMVKKIISRDFKVETGKVIVETPFVGGGYGGKASVHLEIFAYIASRAVRGRKVKIMNSREEDITVSPVHIGLEATIRLSCTKEGKLTAAKMEYLFDGGAYGDKSPHISTAGAVDCTGPYKIDHVWCDSYNVYTNHPYAAPFRGFSHGEVHFAFERAMDMLARKVNIDPLTFRQLNAIKSGDTTPTQVVLTNSTVGNVEKCITKLRSLLEWEKGQIFQVNPTTIRVKGISCSWKNSTIGPAVSSGVVLTFNSDGTINLMSGLVEIGSGTKTVLAQMLATKMRMNIDRIHVRMTVDTQTMPEHWKTVASRGTLMAGRAVLAAADHAIDKLKKRASTVLRVPVNDLEIGNETVYMRTNPNYFIRFTDIVYGYTYPNGNSVEGQLLATGSYTLTGLTNLDPETGKGNPGPEWTVACQGIEVELDLLTCRYKVIKAVSVVDIGEVLNFKGAMGQVKGAMSMGLSWAAKEALYFDENGRVLNNQLRTYRPIRFGEHPKYVVEFVKTPHLEAPYGGRGGGEQGLVGIPAALANALSLALQTEITKMPLTPESIWKQRKENNKW
ncbi:xanthine dehydrogenase family protein molybdopterin-binding subunit [Bacillus sp. B1-b2]|uniref:xanthine dehydrogenase family protein molybdopterin-binding subunit n=1 Tax=Bacillus sp. B1-b2 TaxID=2653201 RepID=UPI001261B640|nr:xanthine dehydrogenase family protein molybdopterin-binding subunit [Bacillus sp. B1-b2]KAB7664318.1 xanthine dehydrogenase family protein molybdopterin-binding subunit [Bacillus sp. B1-b2]